MADQFVNKQISLEEVIKFIRAQEVAARDQAQENESDWDYYHLWNDHANTLDQIVSALISHFNEVELREASFKINNGRSELAGLMARDKIVIRNRMRAERRATKTVSQMSDNEVCIELARRGYDWNGKQWVMGR